MKLSHYTFLEAGNYSSRPHGTEIDGVVIHYTAGGNGRHTAHWARGKIGASWHFLGCRDGYFIQQVGLGKKAWHAGRSEWAHSSGETISGANNCTIGIELANHGPLERGRNGKFYYEINGEMFRYQGPEPVFATLTYDNGLERAEWWEPYPEEQLLGLNVLLTRLEGAGVPMRLRGHEEIAMPFGQRKFDPGPLFPWYRYGRFDGRRTASSLDPQ